MGDPRRFHLFGELIAQHFSPEARIADVAGGKGHLKAKLYQMGFNRVMTWDRRPRNASGRHGYRYGLFDYRSAPRDFDLIVGMHPDEATDHIIAYACKHRVPFLVCPCCVRPSAAPYQGCRYDHWISHLKALATDGRMKVAEVELPMRGRNLVLIGRPVQSTPKELV